VLLSVRRCVLHRSPRPRTGSEESTRIREEIRGRPGELAAAVADPGNRSCQFLRRCQLSVTERAIHAGEVTGDAAMTARLDSTGDLHARRCIEHEQAQ